VGIFCRELCKKTGGPYLNNLHVDDVFLCEELPFGGCNDCMWVKMFSGIDL